MTKERIIEKLKKIRAHAKSATEIGNEAEAQAFADMLADLLTKHDVDMSEIEWEEEVKINAIHVQWTTKCMYPNYRLYRLPKWVYHLGTTIAQYSQCEILVSPFAIFFVGMESHAVVAKETMDYMFCVAERLSYKAYNKAYSEGRRTKNYRESFLVGFIDRLEVRMHEYQESLKTSTEQSTALVRIGQALKVAKEGIKKWQNENPNRKKKEIGYMEALDTRGYREGVRIANQMNIGGKKLEGS